MEKQDTSPSGAQWRQSQAVKANNWKQLWTALAIVAALLGVYVVLWSVRASSRLDDDVRAVLSVRGVEHPTSRELEEMRALILDTSRKTGRSTEEVAASMAGTARAR